MISILVIFFANFTNIFLMKNNKFDLLLLKEKKFAIQPTTYRFILLIFAIHKKHIIIFLIIIGLNIIYFKKKLIYYF